MSETLEDTTAEIPNIDSPQKRADELEAILKQRDNKEVLPEVISAREVIMDKKTVWHSLRGYNFAGLQSVLYSGIDPTPSVTGYDAGPGSTELAVSVSVSPVAAYEFGQEANSFYAYSLQEGISLGISQPKDVYATENYAGFLDEARLPAVRPDDIKTVMLPEHALDTPLRDLPASFESRKPEVSIRHIEQSVDHLRRLGALDMEKIEELVAPYIAKSKKGLFLDSEDNTALQGVLMNAYASVLEGRDVEGPTIRDIMGTIIGSRGDIKVATFDEQLKDEIGNYNSQISHRRSDGFDSWGNRR